MTKEERLKYKKRIKTYEKLGAVEFQKVVFGVEKLKFKIMKKVMPDYIKYCDKYLDHKRKKDIKKAKTSEEVKNINRLTSIYKLEARREFNREENRNYHMNSKNLTDIYQYLKFNKDVHKRGIITDAVLLTGTSIGLALGGPTSILVTALAIELICLGINFECVNIQNYNICRYKLIEDKLQERQRREEEKAINEYNEVAKKVYESLEKNEKLPSMTEIIDSFETTEQVEKFKSILLKEYKEREIEKNKQYSLGGNK